MSSIMYVDQQVPRSDHHTMKVQVPEDHYVELCALKVLSGVTISESVAAALKLYFHHTGAPELLRRPAPSTR